MAAIGGPLYFMFLGPLWPCWIRCWCSPVFMFHILYHITGYRAVYTGYPVADPWGAKRAMPPPCLVKIGKKKDGRRMGRLIFYVSSPPSPKFLDPLLLPYWILRYREISRISELNLYVCDGESECDKNMNNCTCLYSLFCDLPNCTIF